MIVAFTGDRNPNSAYAPIIKAELDKLYASADEILVGDCPTGVDQLVWHLATDMGFKVRRFKAEWGTYGRGAGPIRNREMLDQEPDYLVAIHYDLNNSKGTKNCVETARRIGIPVKVRQKWNPHDKLK